MHNRLQKPRLFLIPGIIGLLTLVSGCSSNENYNRGYVISQSQIDSEIETPSADEILNRSAE